MNWLPRNIAKPPRSAPSQHFRTPPLRSFPLTGHKIVDTQKPTHSPKMGPSTSSLLLLLLLLLSLCFVSFVSVKDLYLSFSLRLLSDLTPTTLPLPNYNSTTLHFWIPKSPPSSSNPNKPSLLLIHGFGGNARWQFEKQIPFLSRSFDLYIPDLIFFGRSTTSSRFRSVEFQARCLVESMKKLGVNKYSVAGISYGGFVAYRVAEMDGEGAVERVVVMTAGVSMEEEERREIAEKESGRVFDIFLPEKPVALMELMRRSMYRPPRWVPEFLLRDFIQVMYKDRRKERVELLKDLLANGIGVNPLPILKQETLILWGDKDAVFPISLAYRLQRHLGVKARLEVIKDAGHALPLEKPDLVNHIIESFLSEQYRNVSS